MPFTKMKLTTFGKTLETKWRQGKGVHFTRVAFGDGLLGNGSMINRTSLVSERHSVKIDAVVAAAGASKAEIIATLDNADFAEGFPYRELSVMAKDPDTGVEGCYLYDYAGQECEYLDTPENGTIIHERIKIVIQSVQIETITFEPSGNPLYATDIDIANLQNQLDQKAGLTLYGPASMMETLPLHWRLLITDPDSATSFVSYQDLIWEAQKVAAGEANDLEGMAVLSAVNATNLRRTADGNLWTTDTLADFRSKLTSLAASAVAAGYVDADGKCIATWAQAQAWIITGVLLTPLEAESQDYPWRRSAPKTELDDIKERLTSVEQMMGQTADIFNKMANGG